MATVMREIIKDPILRQDTTKILVVDDEIHICEMLEEFLTMIGFQVVTTEHGEKAFDLFERESPDIVFLDVKMPGISGIDILGRLKETGRIFGAIMLSAFGDDQTIHDAMKAGANHYIQKPMDFQQLREKLVDLEQTIRDQRCS
jgi:DNA-binding response OmpR family regulator